MTRLATYALLVTLLGSFGSCRNEHAGVVGEPGPTLLRDLPEMRLDGQLVLLTENTSSSYYLYKGKPMGFDYDLMYRFASDHGLRLKVKVVENLNSLIKQLNEGEGDVIACNLAITEERLGQISFSPEIGVTRQVLVQRKEQKDDSEVSVPFIRNPEELSGKTVYVHPFSSYCRELIRMEGELGIAVNMKFVGEEYNSEDLLRMVSEGEIDYTVTDENKAILNAYYYRNLDISLALSDTQSIAVGFRSNSDSLRAAFANWMDLDNSKRFIRFTEKKYFGAVAEQKQRTMGEFSSLSGKSISAWDKVIKEQSEWLGWDWRLLAALIYHESRFNPEVRSFAGAFGLMQLMPETGERFGIDTTMTGAENIEAGVKYLRFLEDFWESRVENAEERRKFILASYNIGPGHVQDAMEIAIGLGLDPKVWDNNVEKGMALKAQPAYYRRPGVRHGYCRGGSVVEYVRNVLNHYEHFLQTI